MVFSVHNSFQAKGYRVFRASLFAGLGLTGIVPVIHGWYINYNVPQVHSALSLDVLMGVIYLVGLPTCNSAVVSLGTTHVSALLGDACTCMCCRFNPVHTVNDDARGMCSARPIVCWLKLCCSITFLCSCILTARMFSGRRMAWLRVPPNCRGPVIVDAV